VDVERLSRAGRTLGDQSVELFTYTYSTSVRAAMLAAQFYVAKAARRSEGRDHDRFDVPRTAAVHDHELLGSEWLSKWRRSDAQMRWERAPNGLARGHRRPSAVRWA